MLNLAFYLFMTRGKITVDPKENTLKFVVEFFKIAKPNNSYLSCLTKNLTFELDLTKLMLAVLPRILNVNVTSRLMKGGSGCKLFNIFKCFESNKIMNETIRTSYRAVRKVALTGSYIKMDFFNFPDNLKDTSISKNLSNLIMECYT
ncbi:hypothetical protein CDIK_3290 [Cucumispora dikerogammari]|nr:hypothetical protein CDIK_3290 [Cucumispora dikerogammari]